MLSTLTNTSFLVGILIRICWFGFLNLNQNQGVTNQNQSQSYNQNIYIALQPVLQIGGSGSYRDLKEAAFQTELIDGDSSTVSNLTDSGSGQKQQTTIYSSNSSTITLPPLLFQFLYHAGFLHHSTWLLFFFILITDLIICHLMEQLGRLKKSLDLKQGWIAVNCEANSSDSGTVGSHPLMSYYSSSFDSFPLSLIYFLNPWVMASNVIALSLQNLQYLFILLAINSACIGSNGNSNSNLLGQTLISSNKIWKTAYYYGICLYLVPFTPIVLLVPLATLIVAGYSHINVNRILSNSTGMSQCSDQITSSSQSDSDYDGDTSSSKEPVGQTTTKSDESDISRTPPRNKEVKCWSPTRHEFAPSPTPQEVQAAVLSRMTTSTPQTQTSSLFKTISNLLFVHPFYSRVFRCTIVLGILSFSVFLGLLWVSAKINKNNWDFLERCFIDVLFIRDLRPNLGLFWYMNQLMFLRFQALFLFIFHCHTLVYCIPLLLLLNNTQVQQSQQWQQRYRYGPLAHTIVSVGLLALFRPYPTVIDGAVLIGLYFTIFSDEVLPGLRSTYWGVIRRRMILVRLGGVGRSVSSSSTSSNSTSSSKSLNSISSPPVWIEIRPREEFGCKEDYLNNVDSEDNDANDLNPIKRKLKSIIRKIKLKFNRNRNSNQVGPDSKTNNSTKFNKDGTTSEKPSASMPEKEWENLPSRDDTSPLSDDVEKGKKDSDNTKKSNDNKEQTVEMLTKNLEQSTSNINNSKEANVTSPTVTQQHTVTTPTSSYTAQKDLVLKLTFSQLALSMYPTMSSVWLVRNTGNANFVYFMQLFYQATMVMGLLQFVATMKKRLC